MSKFDYKKAEVYFVDKYVPFSEANVSIASSPVLYGLSIYTVFMASWNPAKKKLFAYRLKDHYERLINSAKIMDFHSFVDDWTYVRFEKTMLELIKRNNIKEDVLVRVTVFIDELVAGTKIHGLKNSVSAYIYPMGQILSKNGINTCISSWHRTPDNSIPSRAKINGSYVNSSLMKNEALLNGYDEAIAIDQHGHITEGTVANLFIVRGGKIITPNTASDILEGITRDSVIKLANSLTIPCNERAVDRSELYVADEVFMCGSSAGIVPVLSVDKRLIGNGTAGPITKKLAATFTKITHGQSSEFQDWLTVVA